MKVLKLIDSAKNHSLETNDLFIVTVSMKLSRGFSAPSAKYMAIIGLKVS